MHSSEMPESWTLKDVDFGPNERTKAPEALAELVGILQTALS